MPRWHRADFGIILPQLDLQPLKKSNPLILQAFAAFPLTRGQVFCPSNGNVNFLSLIDCGRLLTAEFLKPDKKHR
jgi:hypothetical protein